MTNVVTDNCIQCKDTDCISVCPAEAIYNEDDLPENKMPFVQLNEGLSKIWPNLAGQKDPLPDAAAWDGVADKLVYLIKAPEGA